MIRHLSRPASPLRHAAYALGMACLLPAALAAVPEKVSYNDHVRPILSGACFHCHGPDDKTRDAGLRLDTREGAVEDRDGVQAVVPGMPDRSELLHRVMSHDRDEVMPPPKAKKPAVTEEQVATLRRWIEQGAEYEGHWAYQPLDEARPPQVKDGMWPRNEIDAFILSRLQREGISPSAEADRATLIRRVFLDLTGLLPTPEEVHEFVRDPDPGAYERLVDALLASPHYGERWGRHWLDQARYADSNGYTIDSERGMWPYRDWVIKAHNEDMPFDRFTVEQLAGDLLPKPAKSQLIATAFHRNTLINEEGGTNPEQFRVEAVMDRVNTTGAVWLGLTVGCAQCHTHKFDPITHREYYQMYAFFNQGQDVNNKGAVLAVAKGEVFGTGPTAEELRRVEAKKAVAAKPALVKDPGAGVTWTPAQYVEYSTAANAGLQRLPDNSLLADGGGAFNDSYRIVAATPLERVAALRLRVLTHESLPKQGPGLAGNGNFVLTAVETRLDGAEVAVKGVGADHEQPGYPASAVIDRKSGTGWAINTGPGARGKMNADHDLVIVFKEPLITRGKALEIVLRHDLNEKYLVGRFAIEFSSEAPALPAPPAVDAAAPVKAGKARPGATGTVAELMIMKETDRPRETFLFERGDFLRPDAAVGPLDPGVIAAVQAGFPTTAAGKERTFRNRLDLAQWLVDSGNPLTPRVTMNRVWMRYFGRGLVETEEDFGSQGSAPTHPELLDWLGREFIRRGWSMKAMHRLITTSATYRQASRARPDLAEIDPRNLLLARQERLRVEAEIVRDAALCASGLLAPEIGGPGVRPPQPDGVYSFTQNKKSWVTSTGGDRYRRGMYTLFIRSAPHPLFGTFDAPDFQQVCTRRVRSNTPLQALSLANDEAFFEMAQALALRVLREVPETGPQWDAARLRRAFVAALSREPSAAELRVLQEYFDYERQAFQHDEDAAPHLVPAPALAAGVHPAEAAALVCVARVLLNSDSFITRE